jgi:hypothetical protein
MKLLFIGILSIVLALTGCAASGPRYSDLDPAKQPALKSQARLIIFRTKENGQYSARSATLKIDGTKVGSVDYGGFNTFDVSPGKHLLGVDMWDAPGKCELPVETTTDNIFYFEVTPRINSFLAFMGGGFIGATIESSGTQCGGAFSITPVDQSIALPKLTDLRLSE